MEFGHTWYFTPRGGASNGTLCSATTFVNVTRHVTILQ